MPSPTASGTGYAKAHTLGLASFVVGAGLLVPLSVGTTFHLYVLSQFDRSNGPTISLSMAWCYGILLCYLGYLWAVTYLPTERQSNIVTIMRTRSLQANLLLANLFVIRTTLLCQFALHFPRVVTTVSMQGTRTMLWLTGRDMATAVLSEERFDRASVLSILLVTLGLCLVRPMHKILSSWAAGVWEREYLVERKLKNIDDPVASGESTQPEVNVQQE